MLPPGREVDNNQLGYKERPPTSSKINKLILDQNNKYEYPIHSRMLKFVVKMGIKATKVHRIIKFKQDYIIRDYIELNTKMRAEAKTESCLVCGNKCKNQIGLQTHMNKNMRESVISTDSSFAKNYTIKLSFNQRQLYITKTGYYINDINEPIDYILDGFKPFK